MFLPREELEKLLHAEEHAFPSPIPTQMISNGEFASEPQTAEQRQVEERIKDLGDRLGRPLDLVLNSAGHYGIDVAKAEEALKKDALSAKKTEYLEAGPDRSNLAYGFIAKRI